MNLKSLSIFKRNKISAFPVTIAETPDANGVWGKAESLGTAIIGMKWTASSAEKYYGQLWASDVVAVFVTDDPGDTTARSILRIDSIDYAVDSVIQASEEDIYTIGLKRQK